VTVTYLPSWFPGAQFKRIARDYKATMNKFLDEPYEWVKDQMVSEIDTSESWASAHRINRKLALL
jgi:hypothetical protein